MSEKLRALKKTLERGLQNDWMFFLQTLRLSVGQVGTSVQSKKFSEAKLLGPELSEGWG